MTEAVIVSTARTPIGRAGKGSLKDMRPDDLSAIAIGAVLDKIPELDRTEIEYERQATLVKKDVAARSKLDDATAARDEARGDLNRLKAELQQAELQEKALLVSATGAEPVAVAAKVKPLRRYLIVYSRNRKFARLHEVGKCPASESDVIDSMALDEAELVASMYDSRCKHCWPDGQASDSEQDCSESD